MHTFYGTPKKGQDLKQVKDLLLNQIEEVKSGNFPDWLIEAIISDLKLAKIKLLETNSGRANEFVNSFILDMPWDQYQNEISILEKITKEDVVNFAKEKYGENYVVVV